MPLLQPKRRKNLIREENGKEFNPEFNNNNQLVKEKAQTYPKDMSEISSSVVFYFNTIEDIESNPTKESLTNKNYYDWSGGIEFDDVPFKNSAWASNRSAATLLNEITQSPGFLASSSIVEAKDHVLANANARPYKRTDNIIHMLTPNTLQFNYGAGWQDVDFDLNALGLAASIATTDAETLKTLSKEIFGLAIEALGGSGGGSLANALTKSVANPYTQQSFSSMQRRTFQFNWILSPKNAAELESIDQIISLLKFHMHPSLTTIEGTGTNYLNFPGQIDVEWYFKDGQDLVENAWLPKISTCVIESVQTDFTPNGQFSFYRGSGAPTQINLSVQLKEVHPLQKLDIARGF